ncbi:hypothetical protein [Paraburkholderia sp. JHI869]|uniref:hypothetical protein n=1 Tax=Paraburkholderia sp. JHI869 TaxID=3112959 RepID=UPI00319E3E12
MNFILPSAWRRSVGHVCEVAREFGSEKEVHSRIVALDTGTLDLQLALDPATAGKYWFWATPCSSTTVWSMN